MNRRFFAALVLISVGASCTKEIPQASQPVAQEQHTLMTKLVGETSGEIKDGSLLIKLDEKTTDCISNGEGAVINQILSESGAENISPALAIKPRNEAVARKYGLHRWYQIRFSEEKTVQDVAAKVAEFPFVTSVQYNTFLEPVRSDKVVEFMPLPVTKESMETYGFDDPYMKYQWNLINNGDKSVAKNAVAGADVGVKDAWKLTAGDPSVVVAVFDCAVNSLHEDLKNALWINEAELNGELNKDDDGNGFIDDKYGFNFVGCTETKDGLMKGNLLNWTDGSGHGTHVAGIIGATNGNGKGVSSIAGGTGNGDGVRLMTCQIFQGSKNTSDDQTAAAFIYAADNGACIAQCSYREIQSFESDNDFINGEDGSPMEHAALLYFLDPENSNHESLEGNIAVFAAGNDSWPRSGYPGALPNVLSVTAFGADYKPAGYTNYGPGCKISAPGGEFYDDKNYGMMILSTGVSNAKQPSPGIENNQNYVYMQGTSMACPHVSGVVALGISYAKKLGKKFSRADLQSMLLTSVNDIDGYCSGTKDYYDLSKNSWTKIDLGGYNGNMGTGAVDAWKFLMAIEGTPTILVQAGKKMSIDISPYCNPYDDYKITADDATKTALGMSSDPVIRNGKLEIECTTVGSGKIILNGKVGKDPDKEDGIGDMSYSRTLSIASRPFATNNGGWL